MRRRPMVFDIQKVPPLLRRAPVLLGTGVLGGAALGRYLAPAVLRRLGFNPEAKTLGLAGGAIGALPGLLASLAMQRAQGDWTAPFGSPSTSTERADVLRASLGQWQRAKHASFGRVDPQGVIQAEEQLWQPTFGVGSALNTVTSNALASPVEKLQQMQLVSRAAHEQDGMRGGVVSPAALMRALPQVVSNAIPTVGGAVLLGKVLGAPSWARKGAIGGALAYSAFKSFMEPAIQ